VRAALILLHDEQPASQYPIAGTVPLVVGRSSTSDVQVRDAKLSRRHCEIRATPHGFILRDLASKNGTFLNGARVAEARLRDGDRIQIGLTRMVFRCEEPAEATEVAPPQLCAACGRLVPLDQLGDARQTEERIYCPDCVADNALVGRTVGGYEIIQLIGRGSMGTVFKAEQLSMSRPVALKILHRELTSNRDAVGRFLREARAGGQLSHPNIIRIYDMNQAEGLYFISMEFVPGGDVGSLLDREGPLDPARVVSIAAQACKALVHAHERGVIHRDIKPSNLLLGRDGLIKVADLGLAKSLDAAGVSSLTATGTALGTLAYVPPEQVVDAGRVDHRADIYSLGATAWHLLAGEPPFRGATVAQLALAVRSTDPRPLADFRRDIPAPLGDLILRAMAKDPDLRHQTAAELLAALEALKL
jgi:pSer/pThr/pTyr-binding forkhead associated (FHA) protein